MKVRVVEGVVQQLREWSEEAAPTETGGVLLGVYADEDPWITHAVLIDKATRTGSRYELPAGVTQSVVLEARQADERLGYLGDWHSHPADVGPSPTDLGSLRQIARRAMGRGHRPPVIIVVRHQKTAWLLDGRIALRWPFGTRTVDIVFTGPPSTMSSGAPRPQGSRPRERRRRTRRQSRRG